MTTTTGTCTITRLRNGDIIYATLQFSRATSVAYNDGTIAGGFSGENPLVVKILLTSSSGSNVTLDTSKPYLWKCDSESVVEKGIGSVATDGTLTIVSNDFMDATAPRNHIFDFAGTVRLGGVEHTITKSFEVTMISSGGNSYWGSIIPNGSTVLNANNESVILVPHLSKGGNEVNTSDYTVKWFRNNETAQIQVPSKNLTVTRDMVDGASLFRCEFYATDGTLLEVDGITILDVTDEYQIVLNSEYQVTIKGSVTIVPQLYSANLKQFVAPKSWSASVKNNFTLADISTGWSINAKTGAFSMNEEEMYYIPAPTDANFIGEGKKVEYNPIVIFTAEI